MFTYRYLFSGVLYAFQARIGIIITVTQGGEGVTEIEVEIKTQGKAMEDMGKILRANLMDDFYMRKFFDGDVECIQYVLRIIMGDKGLIVKEVKTQKHLKGPKHNVFYSGPHVKDQKSGKK